MLDPLRATSHVDSEVEVEVEARLEALFGSAFEHWRAANIPPPPLDSQTEAMPAYIAATARYVQMGQALLAALPPKAHRSDDEASAAHGILAALRESRDDFLAAFVEPLYAEVTQGYTRFVRVENLVYLAAEAYPWLTPPRAAVDAERALKQADKEGVEIEQGIFLSRVLGHPRAGAHLVHAMLRPREESERRLEEFLRTGLLDFGTARVQRRGSVGYVYPRNTRFLNAEDDTTTSALETAVDLVLLDPRIHVGVFRGATVAHPKYAGRHVFSAGLNLTHLYHGKISYLFFMVRDLGYVNKLYRGLTGPRLESENLEHTLEKPWVAAVEAFAIGGGCQLLLVMDRVLAEEGAFFNLPARKEGIIPGAANLRLPRFVGDRLARQAILFDRQFLADSPEGRLLCDEIVPPGHMDAALARTLDSMAASGVVSAAGNRKALRVAQEPLDLFRRYMAVYAREQAFCHFSPQLIANLERNWRAHERPL